MRKIFSVILLFALSLSMFTACSGASELPTTEPTEGVKKPTMNIFQKSDPSQDDTINILMIGNSYCYYYADELVGMAAANGIKLRVCNVYFSGCPISDHYKWWKEGQSNYSFITHDENGRTETKGTNLEYCLKQGNWDAISLQTGTKDRLNKTPEQTLADTREQRKELWDYIKMNFPQSKYYWHQTWTYQLGADRYGVLWTDPSQQHEKDAEIAVIAKAICKEDGLIRIPSGPAWRIVRDGGYDNLCARMGVNGGLGDCSHDGDTGGGQYLNACVWFETLLGQSCIGNTWRPNYTLSEEMITMLQQAAHTAVEQMKAEDGI